ncbi:hypothetical protein G9F31_00970 [Acinetobacter sp. 187]|uniref:hypothetical protein n=1 Tax=Acinetobacter lanii TaxID=2715163 RepID=UPI00140AC354|nr:hypothetical protein [Acinetobacter lanii]NHC02356.1 hypothetical protein [Acinetobacter lanii]
MKERPILFNTEMVTAILEGRKTQTRRVINPQPVFKKGTGFHWKGYMYGMGSDYAETVRNFTNWNCPMGRVGDRLWVRETFCYGCIDEWDAEHPDDRRLFVDQYDGRKQASIPKQWCLENNVEIDDVIWKPSIHMPRSASRILLKITNIRVERIQDISAEDALAEGITHKTMNCPRHEFFQLWNSVHGDMAHELNPWVWVIEFNVNKEVAA